MSLFKRLFGGKGIQKEYPTDEVNINGKTLRLRFFAHASIAIEYEGRWIYVDPVKESADYANLPKADIILVTHHHFDHFDMAAIELLQKEDTRLLLDKTSAEGLGGDCYTMLPKGVAEPISGISVEAVAAYNTSEGHTDFHPKQREDCGYVITLGEAVRIYVSGDSEPTDEMLALRGVDIAFLAVNQPYTMTPEQVAGVVKTLQPKIFYPYHYGQVDEPTDVEALARMLQGVTDVRIRPLA